MLLTGYIGLRENLYTVAYHGFNFTNSGHLKHTVVMREIKPTIQPDTPNAPNPDCGPAIPNARYQTMAKTRVPDRYKKSMNINKRLTLSPSSKYIPHPSGWSTSLGRSFSPSFFGVRRKVYEDDMFSACVSVFLSTASWPELAISMSTQTVATGDEIVLPRVSSAFPRLYLWVPSSAPLRHLLKELPGTMDRR